MTENTPPKQSTNTATPQQPQPTTGPAAPGTKSSRPGGPQRGRRRRQKSRFGQQVEEKQSLKSLYGIREKQLQTYYQQAQRSSTETGPAIISLLELRLDNALFRAGFAVSRPAARQMASHRLVEVNGRPVDVPSLRLKVGDTVAVKEGKRTKPLFENFVKRLQHAANPSWMTVDADNYSLKITAIPTAEEASPGVDMRAIVEYFAR